MDNAQALKQLKALLKVGGALQIITAEHACGANARGPADAKEEKVCDAYTYPTTHPKHFVIHEAMKLQEKLPSTPNQIRLYSKEGDWTQGQPSAVLSRLLEAGQAPELPEPLVLGDVGFEGGDE